MDGKKTAFRFSGVTKPPDLLTKGSMLLYPAAGVK